MRWNHRVWETDRATRLDRMGSPAKWMREHYRPPLSSPPLPPSREQGLVWLRELVQVNCTSFFRAAHPSRSVSLALAPPLPLPSLFRDRFFWGKIRRKFNHALSERAGVHIYYQRIMQRYLPRTH